MVLRILTKLFSSVRKLVAERDYLKTRLARVSDDNEFLARRNNFLIQENRDVRHMWERAEQQLRLFSSKYGETFGMSTHMVENIITRLSDAESAARARGPAAVMVSEKRARALGLKEAHDREKLCDCEEGSHRETCRLNKI